MKIAAVEFNTTYKGDLDISRLERAADITYYGVIPQDKLAEYVKDFDGVLVNKLKITGELLDICPRIKYVGTLSTGYNNIDVAACAERGVTVCNVPAYSTEAVCQHVFALLLSFIGKTGRYVESVRAGDWAKSEGFCYFPWSTSELYGKTFGIVGYGNIGSRVASVADAFGMKVIVNTLNPPVSCPYETVTKEELFRRSDFISLHCPLSADNAGMINRESISVMKKNVIIINTARGLLVDENALADALNSGRIAGACLDTLSEEPPVYGSPLISAKNCMITPHIAWVSVETRQRLIDIVAQNIEAYRAGHPRNVVSQ